MSEKIKVEGRVVKSFTKLFGIIGGLRDFFSTVALVLIGNFQARKFAYD
jgi:hypothetical protein